MLPGTSGVARVRGDRSMRPWGVVLLTTATVAWGPCVAAQTTTTHAHSSTESKKKAHAALFQAAFAPVRGADRAAAGPEYSLSALGLRGEQGAAGFEAPFVMPAYTGTSLDQTRLGAPLHVVDGG